MKLHSSAHHLIHIKSFNDNEIVLLHSEKGEITTSLKENGIFLDTTGLILNVESHDSHGFSADWILNHCTTRPEVVLIGTGTSTKFLPPTLMHSFIHAQLGYEQMDNFAACRTFNILAQEGRHVVLFLSKQTG